MSERIAEFLAEHWFEFALLAILVAGLVFSDGHGCSVRVNVQNTTTKTVTGIGGAP